MEVCFDVDTNVQMFNMHQHVNLTNRFILEKNRLNYFYSLYLRQVVDGVLKENRSSEAII